MVRRRGPICGVVLAAEGAHVVGCEVSVAHDHGDSVEGDHELVGDLLGKRGADVLADLDLAGEDGERLSAAMWIQAEMSLGTCWRSPPKPRPDSCAGRFAGEADEQAAAEELAGRCGGRVRSSAARWPDPGARISSGRRGACSSGGSFLGECRGEHRGALHGGDDARIGATAADVAVHAGDDLRPRWAWA